MDEDKKNEQEAQKRGEEILNKEGKKNKKIQKIIYAIKAVMASLMLLIKILPILLLVVVIFTIFGVAGSEDAKAEEQEETQSLQSIVSSETQQAQIVNLNINEEDIKKFINNYEGLNDDLKTAMLDNTGEIKAWQDTYGYSATILIAIAAEEPVSGDGFTDFLNDMNTKASKWKENGLTTLDEIAKDYVGDDSAKEWSNNISDKIWTTSLKAGIIEYGEQAVSGKILSVDGYDNCYISSIGIEYLNYKQGQGWYSHYKWFPSIDKNALEDAENKDPRRVDDGNKVSSNGCSLISVTIIYSGLYNSEINPIIDIAKNYNGNSGLNGIESALKVEGLECTKIGNNQSELSNDLKSQVQEHVETGHPAVIKVVRSKGSKFPSGENHFMAILDCCKVNGKDMVYLSNPSCPSCSKSNVDYKNIITESDIESGIKNGWIPLDIVLKRLYTLLFSNNRRRTFKD